MVEDKVDAGRPRRGDTRQDTDRLLAGDGEDPQPPAADLVQELTSVTDTLDPAVCEAPTTPRGCRLHQVAGK